MTNGANLSNENIENFHYFVVYCYLNYIHGSDKIKVEKENGERWVSTHVSSLESLESGCIDHRLWPSDIRFTI